VSRLPALAFAALVAATVAAFFVTQHLKVSTPLLAGQPAPVPAYINPAHPQTCLQRRAVGGPRLINYGRMRISFYLLHQSDDVRVTIVDSAGTVVRTIAAKRHMVGGANAVRSTFYWDGRVTGGAIAADGAYYIHVTLLDQDRTVVISTNGGEAEAVTVKTRPPAAKVAGVMPSVLTGSAGSAAIHYQGNQGNRSLILIYRSDAGGRLKLVKSFITAGSRTVARWDGKLGGRPAPQGTYLVGIKTTDRACNTTRYPATLPPAPGSTPRAGLTVQYLAAQPPLVPVTAGRRAVVAVQAGGLPYR
jgi:FlgD Ig-like domain